MRRPAGSSSTGSRRISRWSGGKEARTRSPHSTTHTPGEEKYSSGPSSANSRGSSSRYASKWYKGGSPGYSWIRVKVGLVTAPPSMPKPWAKPRVKVVLPAPKDPVKATVVPGAMSPPNSCASRWVSPSSRTTTVQGWSMASPAPPAPASRVFPRTGFRFPQGLYLPSPSGRMGNGRGPAQGTGGLVHRPAQHRRQFGQGKRFPQEGRRPGPGGLFVDLGQREAAPEHHRRPVPQLPFEGAGCRQPVQDGHAHVHEHHVGVVLLHQLQGRAAVGRLAHHHEVGALPLDKHAHSPAYGRIIVGHHQAHS